MTVSVACSISLAEGQQICDVITNVSLNRRGKNKSDNILKSNLMLCSDSDAILLHAVMHRFDTLI